MSRLKKHSRLDTSGDAHNCPHIPASLQAAMGLLLQGHEYAAQTSGNLWEFAVEIGSLRKLGVTNNDLRWLVRMGYVDHAREVTSRGEDSRVFRPTGDLTFTKKTCFVLTTEGIVAHDKSCDDRSSNIGTSDFSTARGTAEASATSKLPKWDAEKRQLTLGGQIVKRFKWHAVNQEKVLAAFEEEGWPQRIDDPLIPKHGQDSKRRLSDTIKWLNRKQENTLLRFSGDGTGEGVIWEVFSPNDSNGQQD